MAAVPESPKYTSVLILLGFLTLRDRSRIQELLPPIPDWDAIMSSVWWLLLSVTLPPLSDLQDATCCDVI